MWKQGVKTRQIVLVLTISRTIASFSSLVKLVLFIICMFDTCTKDSRYRHHELPKKKDVPAKSGFKSIFSFVSTYGAKFALRTIVVEMGKMC